MTKDGKALEELVAFVERELVPAGFTVEANAKVYDEGVQIAELDIVVKGRVGSTDFSWLIECRDRPSAGAAPRSWVDQLIGRRQTLGFNKVTAVSTTGFSAGAKAVAAAHGIELREVAAMTPGQFEWMVPQHFTSRLHRRHMERLDFIFATKLPPDKETALNEKLATVTAGELLLRSSTSGEWRTGLDVWNSAPMEEMFASILPNAPPTKIAFELHYAEDDHFILETSAGDIPVMIIRLTGNLEVSEEARPQVEALEYRHVATGEPISQRASFAPVSVGNASFALEFHKVVATGETHVLLRRKKQDTANEDGA